MLRNRYVGPALMLAVLAVAGLPALAESAIGLGDGPPMTDIKMTNVDGEEISIAEAMGTKGTLVLFTCNACPWVKAWEERIVELGNEYSSKGIGVIAINSNDPGRVPEDGFDVMKQRAEERGVRFPYVVDATSDVARAFGATKTPEAFLFDAKGKLVYHGTIDDNAREPDQVSKRYLKDALEAVTQGADVPMKQTKALGCSIKFRS